jgi:hypothetical protein
MVLDERVVCEDLLVDGACRVEDKTASNSPACRFNELEHARNIPLDELDPVASGPANPIPGR